ALRCPVGAAGRPNHGEAAECRWRSVIGMSFQFSAQLEHGCSVKRIATEPVQRKKDTETNCCAASKPATAGNSLSNGIGKRKGATPCLLEKSICRLGRNSGLRRVTPRVAHDRDFVMNAQRDTQTIKARPKIGSASGNTNGNLLHSYAPARLAVRPTAR